MLPLRLLSAPSNLSCSKPKHHSGDSRLCLHRNMIHWAVAFLPLMFRWVQWLRVLSSQALENAPSICHHLPWFVMLDVDLESGTEIFNVADDPTSPPLLSPLPLCRDSCGQFRSVISDKNESSTQLESAARNGSKESLEGEEENQNFRSLWDKAPSEVLIGPG